MMQRFSYRFPKYADAPQIMLYVYIVLASFVLGFSYVMSMYRFFVYPNLIAIQSVWFGYPPTQLQTSVILALSLTVLAVGMRFFAHPEAGGSFVHPRSTR
jgi:hypothetical protein